MLSDFVPADAASGSNIVRPLKNIRSFVIRNGRTTAAQSRALGTLSQYYSLAFQEKPVNWSRVFWRKAPLILEIGFGMGEASATIAQTMPEKDFIACEVYNPGVGALLARIEKNSIHNIRIVQHDAVEVLLHMVADSSLNGVHIFFPDPWHKKRHHKRRLIQAPLLQLLAQKLQPQGYLHLATDWEEYALRMRSVLHAQTALTNTSQRADGFVEKPAYRPRTKFENRGLRLGHGVWDLLFHKV